MNSEEVISILRKHSGKNDISMSDSVVDDLELNGDDADELYFELLDDHQIDLKEFSHIEDCFHTEGELLDPFYFLKCLVTKIGLSNKPVRRILNPLKVSEIVEFCVVRSENT